VVDGKARANLAAVADITMRGQPYHTSGDLPRAGSRAPDFRLVGADLRDVSLSTFKGKTKILNIVPSLDTFVCAASAKRFNKEASSLPDVVVLVVSADLPFAMKRFCAIEGLNDVVPLSMMRGRAFAKDYGVLIVDGPFEGVTARAVVVVDPDELVRYAQLVADVGSEPDYDAALTAARG
jgi:thioredoxin-dependent peroxiredoxin